MGRNKEKAFGYTNAGAHSNDSGIYLQNMRLYVLEMYLTKGETVFGNANTGTHFGGIHGEDTKAKKISRRLRVV